MTSTTTKRVTNAQILDALTSLGERVTRLEGPSTVAAKPASGKANTRKGAKTATKAAPVAKVKVLTRKRAASFRSRYPQKYAGLTRAAMIEAGLGARGYTLPTGDLRKALSRTANAFN